MENDYKYAGVKLFPSIFTELLIQLFDGKQFSRKTAINTISDYHVSHGGKLEEGRDIVSVFKKATQTLQKTESGLINKGYGTWELHYRIKESTEVVEEKKTADFSFSVDEVLGAGNNAIYVYYYQTYKQLAEIQNKTVWPCKIGRSDVDPLQRVFGQAGTCYPELPHIALIIKCDDSAALENAFHSVLKYQNKWIKEAPGTEWFMTSPQEIKNFYTMISI